MSVKYIMSSPGIIIIVFPDKFPSQVATLSSEAFLVPDYLLVITTIFCFCNEYDLFNYHYLCIQ